MNVSEPRPNRFSVVMEQRRQGPSGSTISRATIWLRLSGDELRIELISSDSRAALGSEVEDVLRQL